MAKPELGTKRVCPNCGAKYYDLNRDPIVCPRCGTHFEAANTRVRAQAAPEPEEDEDEVEAAPADAEFVTLEEADEEAKAEILFPAEVEAAPQPAEAMVPPEALAFASPSSAAGPTPERRGSRRERRRKRLPTAAE